MSTAADNTIKFFLGTSTPHGFVSCYQQSYNIDDYDFICIIKGGPCKQAFINRVASKLLPYDKQTEYIFSSLNPSCCDGVIFHTLRAAIFDGSAPHTLEPRYYDAFETLLPLGEFCDKDFIRNNKAEIMQLTDSNANLYERCVRFVNAAGSLLDDTYSLALACTDDNKIGAFCERTLSREIKHTRPQKAKERSRFLSAITPDGILLFENTVGYYCTQLYVIEDEFGAASNLILQRMKDGAMKCGYDVICCWCPFAPFQKLEHVFVPDLGLGFVTSNHWHSIQSNDARTIHSRRFTSLEALSVRKQRISFNKRATNELIDAAQTILKQSQEITGKLEHIYTQSLDLDRMNQTADETADHILTLSHQ